jgi:hypothetical protein
MALLRSCSGECAMGCLGRVLEGGVAGRRRDPELITWQRGCSGYQTWIAGKGYVNPVHEGEALDCPLLWCGRVVRGAIAHIMVAKESPFTVGRGEEAKVAVEGIAVGCEDWRVLKLVFRNIRQWWRYEGRVVVG